MIKLKYNEKGNLTYLTFKSFENTGLVNHCFSTRIGGVSKGHFSELNLSLSRGDNRDNVIENYKIICNAIGANYNDVVMSRGQIHSTDLHCTTEIDRGKGIVIENDIGNVDGFVTNVPNIVLTTFHADCTPLFFLDKVKKVIGVSHAGWRGTVDKMAEKTIHKMKEVYGCRPSDIIAGIGPAIGSCCFEVDEPVVEEFRSKLDFANQYIYADIEDQKKGKYKIDLKKVNAEIMIRSGIKPENIEIEEICTKCHSELFFSHRGMGDFRGNMAAMMELRQ